MIYSLPNGKQIDVPDHMSIPERDEFIYSYYPEMRPRPGFLQQMLGGAQSLGQQLLGAAAPFSESAHKAIKPTSDLTRSISENLAGQTTFDDVAQSFSKVSDLLQEGEYLAGLAGLKDVASKSGQYIHDQAATALPQMAPALAGAKIGAALVPVPHPIAKGLGALAGATVASFPQMFGAGVMAQDEAGKDISSPENLGKNVVQATGNAALQGALALGGIGASPMKSALGNVAYRGLEGMMTGVPGGVAQEAGMRWLTDRNIMPESEEDVKAYREAMASNALLGGMMGAGHAPFEKLPAQFKPAEENTKPPIEFKNVPPDIDSVRKSWLDKIDDDIRMGNIDSYAPHYLRGDEANLPPEEQAKIIAGRAKNDVYNISDDTLRSLITGEEGPKRGPDQAKDAEIGRHYLLLDIKKQLQSGKFGELSNQYLRGEDEAKLSDAEKAQLILERASKDIYSMSNETVQEISKSHFVQKTKANVDAELPTIDELIRKNMSHYEKNYLNESERSSLSPLEKLNLIRERAIEEADQLKAKHGKEEGVDLTQAIIEARDELIPKYLKPEEMNLPESVQNKLLVERVAADLRNAEKEVPDRRTFFSGVDEETIPAGGPASNIQPVELGTEPQDIGGPLTRDEFFRRRAQEIMLRGIPEEEPVGWQTRGLKEDEKLQPVEGIRDSVYEDYFTAPDATEKLANLMSYLPEFEPGEIVTKKDINSAIRAMVDEAQVKTSDARINAIADAIHKALIDNETLGPKGENKLLTPEQQARMESAEALKRRQEETMRLLEAAREYQTNDAQFKAQQAEKPFTEARAEAAQETSNARSRAEEIVRAAQESQGRNANRFDNRVDILEPKTEPKFEPDFVPEPYPEQIKNPQDFWRSLRDSSVDKSNRSALHQVQTTFNDLVELINRKNLGEKIHNALYAEALRKYDYAVERADKIRIAEPVKQEFINRLEKLLGKDVANSVEFLPYKDFEMMYNDYTGDPDMYIMRHNAHNVGGFYDADTNKIYLRETQSPRQAMITGFHEALHWLHANVLNEKQLEQFKRTMPQLMREYKKQLKLYDREIRPTEVFAIAGADYVMARLEGKPLPPFLQRIRGWMEPIYKAWRAIVGKADAYDLFDDIARGKLALQERLTNNRSGQEMVDSLAKNKTINATATKLPEIFANKTGERESVENLKTKFASKEAPAFERTRALNNTKDAIDSFQEGATKALTAFRDLDMLANKYEKVRPYRQAIDKAHKMAKEISFNAAQDSDKFVQLNEAQRRNVTKALLVGDIEGKNLTTPSITASTNYPLWGIRKGEVLKLNPQEFEAAKGIRKIYSDIWDKRVEVAKANGLDEKLIKTLEDMRDNGYIPHFFNGTSYFEVHAPDGQRIARVHIPENILGRRNRNHEADLKKYFQQKFPDATIGETKLVERNPFTRMSSEQAGNTIERLFEILDHTPTNAAEKKLAEDALKKFQKKAMAQGFNRLFNTNRAGTWGYAHELNLDNYIPSTLVQYVPTAASGIGRRMFAKEIQDGLKRVDSDPFLGPVVRGFDDYARNLNGEHEYSKTKTAAFMWTLGGNISSAAINLTNLVHTTWPTAGKIFGPVEATKTMTASIPETLRAIKSLFNKKAFMSDFSDLNFGERPNGIPQDLWEGLQHAQKAGVLAPQTVHELTAKTATGVQSHWEKFKTAMALPFNMTETLNRVYTYISGYNLAKNNPKAVQDWAKNTRFEGQIHTPNDFALAFVEDTQFNFFKENRAAYNRGIWGVPTQFLKYPIRVTDMYLTALKEGFTHADPKYRKMQRTAAALMTLAISSTAGMWGLPGMGAGKKAAELGYLAITGEDRDLANELEEWANKMGGPHWATKYLSKGILGPSLGIDLAGRTGYNVIPEIPDPFSILGGPVSSIPLSLRNAYNYYNQGQNTLAAASLFPIFVQNALKAQVATEEGYTTAKGMTLPVKKPEPGSYENIVGAMGFTPTDKAEGRKLISNIKQMEQTTKVLKERYMDQISNAIYKKITNPKDADTWQQTVNELVQDLSKKNEKLAPEEKIKIDSNAIMDRVRDRMLAAQGKINLQRVPQQMRGRAAQMAGMTQ